MQAVPNSLPGGRNGLVSLRHFARISPAEVAVETLDGNHVRFLGFECLRVEDLPVVSEQRQTQGDKRRHGRPLNKGRSMNTSPLKQGAMEMNSFIFESATHVLYACTAQQECSHQHKSTRARVSFISQLLRHIPRESAACTPGVYNVSHLQSPSRQERHCTSPNGHLQRGAEKHASAAQTPSGGQDRECSAVSKKLGVHVVPLQRVQYLRGTQSS